MFSNKHNKKENGKENVNPKPAATQQCAYAGRDREEEILMGGEEG